VSPEVAACASACRAAAAPALLCHELDTQARDRDKIFEEFGAVFSSTRKLPVPERHDARVRRGR